MENVPYDIHCIYFQKFLNWYLSEIETHNIKHSRLELYNMFIEYYTHYSSFKLNPRLKYNDQFKKLFYRFLE